MSLNISRNLLFLILYEIMKSNINFFSYIHISKHTF